MLFVYYAPLIYILSFFLKAFLVASQLLYPEQVFHASTVNSTHEQSDSWIKQQEAISWHALLRNINPPGAIKGFVVASPSTFDPNYFFSWTRDSALVMRVVAKKYLETGDHEDFLRDYVAQEVYHQLTLTRCNCLGEPKFNPDGSAYDGPWGRPQNDGPALRASTFILFAKGWLHHNGDQDYVTSALTPAIFKDLDYVVDTWSTPCFDLWEEVCGVHFYTLMVMRRALLDGAEFAKEHGDWNRAKTYRDLAEYQIHHRLQSFWVDNEDDDSGYIAVTQEQCGGLHKPSGLDVSVLLAANHALRHDGKDIFTPGSDKILATAVAIKDAFAHLYPINQDQPRHLETAIGRYPEDTYDGYRSQSLGNPWFLATTAYAELLYNAVQEWNRISINNVNVQFFARIMKKSPEELLWRVFERGTPEFDSIVLAVRARADAFLATVHYHARSNGSLSEQYDRYIGYQAGARDLTWSYAAFIAAVDAR